SERLMCFARFNVVDRQPPTTGLHVCFVATSREEVDAFHQAGVDAGYRSNGAPGYRAYSPGYYAAFLLDPDENNIEALYRNVRNPGRVRDSYASWAFWGRGGVPALNASTTSAATASSEPRFVFHFSTCLSGFDDVASTHAARRNGWTTAISKTAISQIT